MHPQFDEALKRIEAAKDAYAHAIVAVDRQYVKPLLGVADKTLLADIRGLRTGYADVGDQVIGRVGKTEALEQPAAAAAAAPKATRKAQATRKATPKGKAQK
jgi:hypothetical protein